MLLGLRRRSVFAPLLLLLLSGRAEAQGLTYTAPAECPAQASVAERLRERTGREPAARVLVRKTDERYAALVSWGIELDASRTVVGETCEGVVEAALLVLAMNQDDTAAAPPPPAPPPPAPPPVASEPPPADRSAPAPSAKKSSLPFAVSSGLTFSGSSFAESLWMFDYGVFVGFEWRRGLRAASWMKPRLALSGSRTFFDTDLQSSFATIDLSRFAGSVEACPTSHELGESVRISFRPCTRFTGSVVWVETQSNVNPGSDGAVAHKNGTWSTLGALGRLRIAFDAPQKHDGEGTFIELVGAVDFTLTANRFQVYGRSPIAPDTAVGSLAFVLGRVW